RIAAKQSASWAGRHSTRSIRLLRRPGSGIVHIQMGIARSRYEQRTLAQSAPPGSSLGRTLASIARRMDCCRRSSPESPLDWRDRCPKRCLDTRICGGLLPLSWQQRVSGAVNPEYESVFVFDNDHPCVGQDAPEELSVPPPPYRVRPAKGYARVICYSPLHNLTMAEMAPETIREI